MASWPESARPRRSGGVPAESRASHTHRQPHRSIPDVCPGRGGRLFIDENGKPVLAPVVDGGHFHNAPGAPHAFVPKVGIPKPDDWEIAFIAITPRNLKEDTHRVSDEVRALYKQAVGQDAPFGRLTLRPSAITRAGGRNSFSSSPAYSPDPAHLPRAGARVLYSVTRGGACESENVGFRFPILHHYPLCELSPPAPAGLQKPNYRRFLGHSS